MGELAIPVRGQSKELAIEALQETLGRMQSELAMETPRTLPSEGGAGVFGQTGTRPSAVPFEILELRIDTLLADLGGAGLTLEAKAQTIKNWTSVEFAPENFAAIITALEEIKTGMREVPAPATKTQMTSKKKA